MKFAGTLGLTLAVLFLGTAIAIECHSISQAQSTNVAHGSEGNDLLSPINMINPAPFLSEACAGIGLLILLVSRKYFPIRHRSSWRTNKLYKLSEPTFIRRESPIFALSLSQLGVSRT